MRIGLDFDNTINLYSKAIQVLAHQFLDLPSSVELSKNGIRDYLRANERETEWTRFQGELYGPGMNHALMQEDALRTMKELRSSGHELYIISHRTKRPQGGQDYDLHKYAREWVDRYLLSDPSWGTKLVQEIFFLPSLDEKIDMISSMRCDIFLDDLPQVLLHGDFSPSTRGVLFDNECRHMEYFESASFEVIRHWGELTRLVTDN